MHWFWRVMIAAVFGALFGQAYFFIVNQITMGIWGSPSNLAYSVQPYGLLAGHGATAFALCTALGIGVYATVTRHWGPRPFERETRCRRCGYILRGLTEPRCPECGESI